MVNTNKNKGILRVSLTNNLKGINRDIFYLSKQPTSLSDIVCKYFNHKKLYHKFYYFLIYRKTASYAK